MSLLTVFCVLISFISKFDAQEKCGVETKSPSEPVWSSVFDVQINILDLFCRFGVQYLNLKELALL